jgi:hypothetical protein
MHIGFSKLQPHVSGYERLRNFKLASSVIPKKAESEDPGYNRKVENDHHSYM